MRYCRVQTIITRWRKFCTNSTSNQQSTFNSIIPGRPTYLYSGFSRIPYSVEPDLDFRQRFADLNALRTLLEQRGCDIGQTFGDLEVLSEKYSQWYEIAQEFSRIYSKQEAKEILKQKQQNDQFYAIFEKRQRLEEECIWTCLRLPADLHDWTPIGDKAQRLATIIRGQQSKDDVSYPVSSELTHLDILLSEKLKRPLIEFKSNPPQCFLFGSTARLLRSLELYFTRTFLNSGYRSFSPTHFVRSAILEAYLGLSPDGKLSSPFYCLPIESIAGEQGQDTNWALHLAGHGPSAYLALFSRKEFSIRNAFPLKFLSTGMAYGGNIVIQNEQSWNLFNFQTHRPKVTLWTMFDDESEKDISQDLTKLIKDILARLSLSFTVEQQSSYKLSMSEMSRVDMLAYSAGPLQQIPVRLASISNYGNFLSRRLRILNDQNGMIGHHYVKCCYAEIDLFNVLARIYEELYPSSLLDNANADEIIDWWHKDLSSFDLKR